MLLSLICGLSLAETITLVRGGEIPGREPGRYWSCEDTTLDSAQPDENRGGDGILEGGPGKTILIKFGGLDRAIGPNRRVVSAKLVLKISGPDQPKLRAVHQMLVPWGEGPIRTLGSLAPPTPGLIAETPRWSSTWKYRRAGSEPVSWQQTGANGPQDGIKIPTAALTVVGGDTCEISGLGPTVQTFYERWFRNQGFALTFDGATEFFSSNAGAPRPQLVIETEPAAPKTGPDLSVVLIERTPEFSRYDDKGAYTEQLGIPFMSKPPNATAQKWPFDGAEVAYIAHIKNVGDGPANGFDFQWSVGEKLGEKGSVAQTLAVGEEVTVTLKKPFKNQHADHRLQPLGIEITSKSTESNLSNNYIEIQECGLSIALREPIASLGFEDRLQALVRAWNELLADTKYSFAREGGLERIRIGRLSTGTGPTETDLRFDAELDVPNTMSATEFISALNLKLGLPDLKPFNFSAQNAFIQLKENGSLLVRGMEDRFAGIAGAGDTRSDPAALTQVNLPLEPVSDRLISSISFEVFGLFSMTEVAGLNSNLGKRRGFTGDVLYDVPVLVVLRCQRWDGKPLANTELSFFQMEKGSFPDVAPTFKQKTNDSGGLNMPNRPISELSPVTTLTGHTLKPNPFGRIDPFGRNGAMLIRAEANGVADYAVLKLSQLVDAYHRGNKGVAVIDLKFNLPSAPLARDINHAFGRPVQAGGQSSDLLTDGKPETTMTTSAEWIELDLGRDRPIGEIALTSVGQFWPKYDIMVYQTGQKPADARMWGKELDLPWTVRNRPGVQYRAEGQRYRYIRVVNRSNQKEGTIGEISVTPTLAP